jgi:hypothetical protein
MPGYHTTEEIDVFATGGPATTPPSIQQQYLNMLQSSDQVAPTSVADIQAEAAKLSQLFGGNQRRPTLYDMATSLSQGLAAQAASGRPPSVGYGLASGFNLFSEETAKKREAADALSQKLMMMAYEKTEKERERQKEFQKLAAQAGFEYQLQQLKETGGRIDGTGKDVWAWNIILEAQDNPQYKIDYPGDYAAAVAIVSQSKQIQTEEGVLEVPGFNVDEIFKPTTPTPGVRVEDGVTYTPVPGKTVGGKQVYVDPNGVEGTLP